VKRLLVLDLKQRPFLDLTRDVDAAVDSYLKLN
jgi:hypothetical protein